MKTLTVNRIVSTGSITLDIALGIGDIPGRIIEIYGPESSVKPHLRYALQSPKSWWTAFIDAEHALDVSYTKD